MNCRHCGQQLHTKCLDLGSSPPSNAYLDETELRKAEATFPLKLMVCDNCWLVQTEDFFDANDLFTPNYAYISSVSGTWLKHVETYATEIISELSLTHANFVVEVASNDGHLLQHFQSAGIPCLGVEPTKLAADLAESQGIDVKREFFGASASETIVNEYSQAHLIIGNNVLAHVPDINDFAKGLKRLLRSGGVITLEFPHVMRLIEGTQFDTVYHEHFSYLSLWTVIRILQAAELRVWRVKELPTHGGSLRVYACHESDTREEESSVAELLDEEKRRGLRTLQPYLDFQKRTDALRDEALAFLKNLKTLGKSVAGYGAAAKGNTFLNFADIKSDLIRFVCDASGYKQGKYLPGSHIPVVSPQKLHDDPPDYLVVLPWNLLEEVAALRGSKISRSTKLVTFIPELRLL